MPLEKNTLEGVMWWEASFFFFQAFIEIPDKDGKTCTSNSNNDNGFDEMLQKIKKQSVQHDAQERVLQPWWSRNHWIDNCIWIGFR